MTVIDFATIAAGIGISKGFLVILIIWIIFWKGFALWKAGRKNQPIWFILILLINTFGIFEILYIFLFSKIKLDDKNTGKTKTGRRNRKYR